MNSKIIKNKLSRNSRTEKLDTEKYATSWKTTE